MRSATRKVSRHLMFVAFCACFVAIAAGYIGRARVQSTRTANAAVGAGSIVAARRVDIPAIPRVGGADHIDRARVGSPSASRVAEDGPSVGDIGRSPAAATPTPAAAVTDGPIAESLAALGTRAGLLFSSTASDRTNGYLAIESLGSPETHRYVTGLRCERVHVAGGAGICLAAERGFFTTFAAHTFGPDFGIRHTMPLPGLPSRARMSPDGRRAAMTIFVSGDSYAASSFSTRTMVLDVATGRVIADLEEFVVSRAGTPFKAIDFNFWGVTFAQDGNRFFATLRTGGTTYLVEGDVDARTARVVREGIECPSLSPDNTRIVFKTRVSASTWRLHLLDLATLIDSPLVEIRNVDDQVEWLDNDAIAYTLPSTATGSAADIWTFSVDSQVPPRILVRQAYSPATLR